MAATLGFTMVALHPVLVALSLAGALLYGAVSRGWRAVLGGLRWQLPLVVLVALVNPLFVREGSTEIARLFDQPVYAESLAFGLTMAGMFIASVTWLQLGEQILPYDKVLALLGKRLPVLGLMVSMTMRLVPRFVRQGRQIASVHDVAVPGEGARRRLRQSSVLMGWALEDSLETADAMRARGWNACPRRTTYARYRFAARDAWWLVGLGAAAVAIGAAVWRQLTGFAFYPVVTFGPALDAAGLAGYVLFAGWMVLPAVLHVYETGRFA
ncbi:MAG: energy-coupling factor transporter transmembrane component T [Coriobacteriaceae bacterium]|nr:energy-coupling factor transporter transmembrane component T [Coriobacteriaceae bacterium]